MEPIEEAAALSTLLPLIQDNNPDLADTYRRRILALINAHTRLLHHADRKHFAPAKLDLTRVDLSSLQSVMPLPPQLSVIQKAQTPATNVT